MTETASPHERVETERLYLDCEFNGFGGELISMALVSDSGREWYAVLPEPRVWNEWVHANVLPVLSSLKPTIYANSREEFRVSLQAFLSHFSNPIIVADWYTDLVHFFGAYAGRDHTESMAYPCRAELATALPDGSPEFPHNALSDARALRVVAKTARELLALRAEPSATPMTDTAGTIPTERLREILAGTEGVTPGPWDWGTFDNDIGVMARATGDFPFAWMRTTEDSYGEGLSTAEHIARLDPQTVAAMATLALEALAKREEPSEAEVERVRKLRHALWRVAHSAANSRWHDICIGVAQEALNEDDATRSAS